MKKVLFILLFVSFALPQFAQTWENVKKNSEYLWGEGAGISIDEAKQNALNDLISKITVTVTGSEKSSVKSDVVNGAVDESSEFSKSIQTYSKATLNNTEYVVLEQEPDARVGYYIKKSEVNKIFEARKQKITEMIDDALMAEEKGKADDALRNYYWALALVKSLQHPNGATYEYDGQARTLTTWIPKQINQVFDDLKCNVVKQSGSDVELYITYKGKPVNSVDYTYYDGQGWSNIYSAKDGRGVLELAAGNTASEFKMKYEYEYRGESQIDDEVEQVLKCVSGTPMRSAYQTIASSVSKSAVAASEKKVVGSQSLQQSFSKTNAATWAAPEAVTDPEYMNITMKVCDAIRTQQYESVRSLFTAEGWEMYKKLIHYGSAKLVGTPSCSFMKCGDYVLGRGMQMSFSFKTGMRKSFVEDVVFSFDSTKKINSIAMGLGQTAADDILNKGDWPEAARVALMNFLENYKTAYALKRLDYIESIFDDEAVIIIGNVVKKRTATSGNNSASRGGTASRGGGSGSGSGAGGGKSSGNSRNGTAPVGTVTKNGDNGMSMQVSYPNQNNNPQPKPQFQQPKTGDEIIRYNRYDKNTYLRHLAQQFAKQEFINIRFANNDVVKLNNGGELYAIQIAQDYYSSTYGDKGYLFLMVDINDPENPIIKVRTWQPERDPNFGLYGPGDF